MRLTRALLVRARRIRVTSQPKLMLRAIQRRDEAERHRRQQVRGGLPLLSRLASCLASSPVSCSAP